MFPKKYVFIQMVLNVNMVTKFGLLGGVMHPTSLLCMVRLGVIKFIRPKVSGSLKGLSESYCQPPHSKAPG